MKIPTAQLFQLMSLPSVLPLSAINPDIHRNGYTARSWLQEFPHCSLAASGVSSMLACGVRSSDLTLHLTTAFPNQLKPILNCDRQECNFVHSKTPTVPVDLQNRLAQDYCECIPLLFVTSFHFQSRDRQNNPSRV